MFQNAFQMKPILPSFVILHYIFSWGFGGMSYTTLQSFWEKLGVGGVGNY